MKNINLKNLIIDFALLSIVAFTGWFLIGYYLQGEYLATYYPDWIYHAWRIKTLILYKSIPSWDYIWSNGLNHWAAYQYLQHTAVFILVKLFHVSITKGMLISTVFVFIFLRVLMYIFLRLLNVRAIIAFLAVIVSFNFEQQWIAIGDFSIFLAFIIVPFCVYLWANVYEKYKELDTSKIPIKKRYLAEGGLAISFGALWMLHPVIANAMGGLFFVSVGFRALKIYKWYFVGILLAYLVGASPFLLPYLTVSAHYSNPIFATSVFVHDTIVGNLFGLGMYFLFFFSIAGLLFIIFANKISSWAKIVLVYVTLYFLAIFLAKYGYLPAFILKFQISRTIPILALLFAMSFAGILNATIQNSKKASKGFIIIVLIIGAIGITEAIKTATILTYEPVKTMDSPISYFDDKPLPEGSIYIKKVSRASYFGKSGLRFITSYNEHLLPQPTSMRYSSLLRSEIAYTSVPKDQINLIRDYSLALGVQYLILPSTSPLIKYLTEDSDRYAATFDLVDIVETQDRRFTILKNKEKINYAYLVDRNDPILKWKDDIPKITLQMNSYKQWDNIIKETAEKIRKGEFVPISKVNFDDTDRLSISLNNTQSLKNKDILLMQSYSNGWKINGKRVIKPSKARFIDLDLDYLISNNVIKVQGDKINIILEHKWFFWHWPVQIFGIIMIAMIIILSIVRPKLFFIKTK